MRWNEMSLAPQTKGKKHKEKIKLYAGINSHTHSPQLEYLLCKNIVALP